MLPDSNNNPPRGTKAAFIGTGITSAQLSTIARLFDDNGLGSTDVEIIIGNELEVEIDTAGVIYSVIGQNEISRSEKGWLINQHFVDDFETAIRVLLAKRRAELI